MSARDPRYVIEAAGSVSLSSNAAFDFFGDYQGLSQLESDDAVYVIAEGTNGNEFRFAPAGSASNDIGFSVPAGASGQIEIPAMRAGDASQLKAANRDLDSNASYVYTVFKRVL